MSALHDFWHGWPLSLIVVVVLEFHPGINRVSSLSVLSDVYSPVFGLWLDTKQVKIVERVKDKETPDGSPQSNADPACYIDAQEIPWCGCVALKLFVNKLIKQHCSILIKQYFFVKILLLLSKSAEITMN